MQFSEKLYALRKGKGLSQEQVAEACGVSRQSVSKWETGLGYPETDTLLTLCDMLDVSLDELLRDANPSSRAHATDTPYADYIGKWVQIFLKDREFHGFYRVAVVAAARSLLLFMDDKGLFGLLEEGSVRSISRVPTEKAALPPVPECSGNLADRLIGKKCEIRLKQSVPLAYAKPGAFYPATIDGISGDVVIFHGVHSSKGTVMLSDVLFIKERQSPFYAS